jgi:biopolymer transport protein ExbD
MRWAVLLALAPLALAGEPEVRLPAASEAKRPVAGAMAVNLTADGLILVDRDGKSERVSLEQLALSLREKKGAAANPREMPVVIRADEKAPWLHVQRLVEACAAERLYRIELGVKGAGGEEGRLLTPLPVDAPKAEPRGGVAKVVVRIAVTKEEPAVWGPTQTAVGLPTEITYRIGEIETKEFAAVRRFIRDAGQTAAQNGDTIQGDIAPEAKIPWGIVVEVLNEFRRVGIPDVKFARADPPSTPEERRAPRLPYPAK